MLQWVMLLSCVVLIWRDLRCQGGIWNTFQMLRTTDQWKLSTSPSCLTFNVGTPWKAWSRKRTGHLGNWTLRKNGAKCRHGWPQLVIANVSAWCVWKIQAKQVMWRVSCLDNFRRWSMTERRWWWLILCMSCYIVCCCYICLTLFT